MSEYKHNCKKQGCAIAFHIGHSWYNKKDYRKSKKDNNLDCCGGTILLNYCPFCGKKIKEKEQGQ